MTWSASPTFVKPISAMTVGCAASSLQNCRSPPTLRITLSMSAAVVPGAKLLATTTYGPPAAPLMLMLPPPFPTAVAFLPALLFLGSGASFEGTLAARWLLLLESGGLVGPRPLRGVALFERGIDAVRCRGCQSGCRRTIMLGCRPYLGHSDSAGQTASNGCLFCVASGRSALATVLAEDVLRELLILALLAALECC